MPTNEQPRRPRMLLFKVAPKTETIQFRVREDEMHAIQLIAKMQMDEMEEHLAKAGLVPSEAHQSMRSPANWARSVVVDQAVKRLHERGVTSFPVDRKILERHGIVGRKPQKD